MNSHEQFEQRLQRQPLAHIPPAWRAEILGAMRAAAANTQASPATTPLPRSSLFQVFSMWLWPHPAAWTGLAALWVLAFGLNLATREPARLVVARPSRVPSPEIQEMLKQQGQMFAELVGPIEKPETERPRRILSGPRSQGRQDFINV